MVVPVPPGFIKYSFVWTTDEALNIVVRYRPLGQYPIQSVGHSIKYLVQLVVSDDNVTMLDPT